MAAHIPFKSVKGRNMNAQLYRVHNRLLMMDLEDYKCTDDNVNKSKRALFAGVQRTLCQYQVSIGFCLNRESRPVSPAGLNDRYVSAGHRFTSVQMTSSDVLHADSPGISILSWLPRHTSNDLSRAHSVRSQSFRSSIEFDDSSMTSSHDYDAVRKDASDVDAAFFDDVGVQATLELTRLHTPPERDVTTTSSKQLAVTNSSDTDSLQDFNPTTGGEVTAEQITELNVSTSSPPPVDSDVNERSPSKTEPTSAPCSLIFTIDFGLNDGKYQITDHWTHPTPFRRKHRRTVSSKTQKSTKERTTNSTDATKLPKTAGQGDDGVRSSLSPEGHAAAAAAEYHSDGHDSAESSDESASVRSEIAGSASNRRNADILRKNLLSSGCPSQSQPSLVQTKKTAPVKPNQKRLTSSSVIAAKTAPGKQQRPAAAATAATSKSHSLSSRPPPAGSLRVSESRSAACKSSSTTASACKDVSKVPPLPSSSAANRKIAADKSRKSGDKVKGVNAGCKFLNGSSEDISSVTAYLIDRMLGRTDACIEAGDDARGRRLSAAHDKKQNGGDNHSDAGTYTIDEEDESADASGRQRKSEVQQARDRIGQVFGINENGGDTAAGSASLVRPVIDGDDCEVLKKVRGVVPDNSKMATEDEVFGEDELHDHYKREIGEAVSNALSATNQAIQHVLGLESRRKGKSQTVVDTGSSAAAGPPGVNCSQSQVGHSMSEQPAVGGKVIIKSPSSGSATSDDKGQHHHRQLATVVCESDGNFGSFTVSYDAPSSRPRHQNVTLESTPSPTSATEPTKRATSKDNPDVDKTVHRSSVAVANKSDIENLSSSDRELAEKAAGRRRVQPAIPRPVRKEKKSLAGLQVARSVGDVSRVFANEPLQRVSRAAPQAGKGKGTPPPGAQSTSWSCWRKDVADTSDAGGSDAESTCSAGGAADHSGGEQRRVALRSAPVVLSTRTNRTFALRCAAKQRAEALNSPGTAAAYGGGGGGGVVNKQNRSRSAENNARLALMSRSRSGSRPRSPKDHHVHQNAIGAAAADCRRRQPSNDSSATSVSLNVSTASHDTAAAAARHDGSRPHGMRVEKSSMFGSLTSLVKQSSPRDRNATTAVANFSHHGKSGSSAASESAESKELTAWKRRKDYDARKSVAEERAKNTSGRSMDQSPGLKANSGDDQQKDLVDVDEIAVLSNAVAHNLNVLSQCTQSEAVTLDLSRHHLLNVDITKSAFTAVNSRSSKKARQSCSDYCEDLEKNSCDAVLVNSIQQMSCKVKTLTDKLMSKIKYEGTKLPDDQSGRNGMPESWQNSSPELAAILDNLKRTEQHLQTVHSTLSTTDRSAGSRGHTSGRGRHQHQIQAVAKQRLHQAEQAGFKPIDNPIQSTTATKNTKSGTTSFRAPIRRQSTGGAAVRRRNSDSSENPLSGEEFY